MASTSNTPPTRDEDQHEFEEQQLPIARLLRTPAWTKMIETSGISDTQWLRYIDPHAWDQPPPDLTQPLEPKVASTYFMQSYYEAVISVRKAQAAGKTTPRQRLRERFQEELEGWTSYQFDQVSREIRKAYVDLLEEVCGPIQGRKINDKLVRFLQEEEEQAGEGQRATAALPQVVLQSVEHDGYQSPPAGPQRAQSINHPTPEQGIVYTHEPGRSTTAMPGSRLTREVQTYPQFAPGRDTHRAISPGPGTPKYELPPVRPVPSEPLDPITADRFIKTWKQADNYTGRPYDILLDRTKIFVQTCDRRGISVNQYHAVFPEILTDRARDYWTNFSWLGMRWDEMYAMLDKHFNTELNHAQYYTDWTATTFARMRQDNADKGAQEVLEMLLDKLRLVQRALGDEYQGERQLHTAVVRACRGVPEFEGALMVQKGTCEALFSDLRASLQVAQDRAGRQYLLQEEAHDAHFTDRRYHRNQQGPRPGRAQAPRWKPNLTPRSSTRSPGPRSSMRTHASPTTFQEKNADYCFVCKKQGCRSWKHTKEEREGARQRYHQTCDTLGEEREDFDLFLTNWEANRPQPHDDTSEADNEEEDEDDQYQAAQFLQSQAFLHRATGENVYSVKPKQQADQFVLHNQYSTTYQGELWDTGAARVSTVGKCQVLAYLRENPRARIDWTPGSTEVRFGGGKAEQAIGTMTMENALGTITYHVLNAQTPFLFCLHDADKLEAYFNNVENVIVRKDGTRVPVVRKWGHPFFNVSRTEAATFFTEQELRRLHRRFGHPRTERLYKLLQEAGHRNVRQDILEKITKICHQCQTHDHHVESRHAGNHHAENRHAENRRGAIRRGVSRRASCRHQTRPEGRCQRGGASIEQHDFARCTQHRRRCGKEEGARNAGTWERRWDCRIWRGNGQQCDRATGSEQRGSSSRDE
ncbi:hypothetical protein MCOR02_012541 [Pyricularia oryzae]|nr:hypothetical protein MCOR02_012541 [Pyricularia oryzae]